MSNFKTDKGPYSRTSYYKIVSYIYDKIVTLLQMYENTAWLLGLFVLFTLFVINYVRSKGA